MLHVEITERRFHCRHSTQDKSRRRDCRRMTSHSLQSIHHHRTTSNTPTLSLSPYLCVRPHSQHSPIWMRNCWLMDTSINVFFSARCTTISNRFVSLMCLPLKCAQSMIVVEQSAIVDTLIVALLEHHNDVVTTCHSKRREDKRRREKSEDDDESETF